MTVQPIAGPVPEAPPAVAALRAAHADLIEDANTAADRMRTGTDAAYRIGQAERSIALHEAAASVRTALDVAENEYPARG